MIEKGGARVRRRFPTVLQMQDAAFPAEVAFFSSSYTATFPIIYHPALSKSLGFRRGTRHPCSPRLSLQVGPDCLNNTPFR